MKKKIFLIAMMVAMLLCVFAVSVSAANNIIKLTSEPTLEQIHANPNAYISRLDEFENGESYANYRDTDANSVVVMFDKAETPTYYVFPTYYLIRSSSYYVTAGVDKLNETIKAADSSAFAGYTSNGGTWEKGECDYIVRIEVPTYVTTVAESYKIEGSVNLKEIYFPVHQVVDPETGVEKTVTYVTSFSTTNFANSCVSLEYVRNSQYLPKGVINTNNFFNCQNLKEFIIPESVTYISSACFKQCYSLTSMVLPNGVTGTGKGAFSTCSNLESISLGASFYKFASSNEDYETFVNCSKLKYIYMPDTAYQCVADNGAHNVKSVFPGNQKLIIFFTGSEENAKTLQQLFVDRGNYNTNFSTADRAAYNENIDYATVQANLTKNLIVYNYNACDAFYNGIHVEEVEDNNPCVVTNCVNCVYENKYVGNDSTHNMSTVYAYANYFANGTISSTCANEGCIYHTTPKVDNETLTPFFSELVYSTKEDGAEFGIYVEYKIDQDAIALYEVLSKKTVNYGVMAIMTSNITGNGPLNKDGSTDANYVVAADVTNTKLACTQLIITGNWAENSEIEITMLGFVTDGEELHYMGSQTVEGAAVAITGTNAGAFNAVTYKNITEEVA